MNSPVILRTEGWVTLSRPETCTPSRSRKYGTFNNDFILLRVSDDDVADEGTCADIMQVSTESSFTIQHRQSITLYTGIATNPARFSHQHTTSSITIPDSFGFAGNHGRRLHSHLHPMEARPAERADLDSGPDLAGEALRRRAHLATSWYLYISPLPPVYLSCLPLLITPLTMAY